MVPCTSSPVSSVSKPTMLWRGNVGDMVVSPPRTYQCFFTLEQSGFTLNSFPRSLHDTACGHTSMVSHHLPCGISSVPESTFPTFQYFWYRLPHTINGHRGILISISLIRGCIFPLLVVHKCWSSNKYSFASVKQLVYCTQSTRWGRVRGIPRWLLSYPSAQLREGIQVEWPQLGTLATGSLGSLFFFSETESPI